MATTDGVGPRRCWAEICSSCGGGVLILWSVGVRKDDSSPTISVPGCRLCGLGVGVGIGYAAESCVLEHVCRFMVVRLAERGQDGFLIFRQTVLALEQTRPRSCLR